MSDSNRSPASRHIGPARLDCLDENGARLYRAELWDGQRLDVDGRPLGGEWFCVQRPDPHDPGAIWRRHPVSAPEGFILEALEAASDEIVKRARGGPVPVPRLRLTATQLERLRGTGWGAEAA